MKVTYSDVKKAAIEETPWVVEDIQHLLENNCGGICRDCEFQYLCIRDEDCEEE